MAGARRFNLDAFLLALEGWRRGLTLRWYQEVPPESNIKLIGLPRVGKFSHYRMVIKHTFFIGLEEIWFQIKQWI